MDHSTPLDNKGWRQWAVQMISIGIQCYFIMADFSQAFFCVGLVGPIYIGPFERWGPKMVGELGTRVHLESVRIWNRPGPTLQQHTQSHPIFFFFLKCNLIQLIALNICYINRFLFLGQAKANQKKKTKRFWVLYKLLSFGGVSKRELYFFFKKKNINGHKGPTFNNNN